MYQFASRIISFLLFSLLFFSPSTSHAGLEALTIKAPKTVGIGQPFLVEISLRNEVKSLSVSWNGAKVRPTITRTKEGMSRAVVLLGTRLGMEPTRLSLGIQVYTEDGRYPVFRTISVVPHKYARETLSVEPAMVNPPKRVQARIISERKVVLKALRTWSPERRWNIPFALPVKGKMLSRFGLHRVFNGESKRRHRGLDFRAWLGTPIYSIEAGKVVLSTNLYFGGNCVLIDHGNGVVSLSAHMSKLLVKQGDVVKRGQRIGLSGATGRVNGAHLHLGIFVQGVAIDPESLFLSSP